MEEKQREAPVPAGGPDDVAVTRAPAEDAPAMADGRATGVDGSGHASTGAGAAGGTGTRVARPVAKGRGGTAGIFAGVAVIAPILIKELTLGREPYLLLPLTMIVLAVALAGFRVAQGGRDGKFGRIGLVIACLGALVLAGMFAIMAYLDIVQNTRLQSGTWLLQFGFFALLGGILLFGSASLVAGVISRGPVLLMMASLVLGVVLDQIGAFPGLRFRWGPEVVLGQGMHYGLKIFGLSLIWLGYSILRDTRAKSADAEARSA
ncbi:MAG TPA: hypothetical protein VM754_13625 [Actinomycetota bacterium]|nr:hypothetical protein [Actinomycetota bacterium]